MQTLLLLFGVVAGAVVFGALASPAAADPPASSGVVERTAGPDFLLFPDLDNGFVVFVNISREDFCGAGGAQEDWNFQFVNSPSAAQLLRIQAPDMPIYLHRFSEDVPPLGGPCEDSQEEPAFVGTVSATLNDNETCPCQNNRTNSFGHRGEGTVYSMGDGGAWHYSWNLRVLVDKNDEFRVTTEKFIFHRKAA